MSSSALSETSRLTFELGANVDQTVSAENRTEWPLTGGSIALDVSHPWALTYVNLGLGNNVTSFNITLVPAFNQTGNGTFCWPEVGTAKLAELGVTEGQNASLQVIQLATSGNALYNVSHLIKSPQSKKLLQVSNSNMRLDGTPC